MAANSKPVVKALEQALADTYALALKTQNYHWNVEGPTFYGLHNLFEEQYTELAAAVDEIAERIRALGYAAPASFAAYSAMATIGQGDNDVVPSATAMVKTLQKDHEAANATVRKAFDAADAAGDEATADLMVERRAAHEKTAWMLRASQ